MIPHIMFESMDDKDHCTLMIFGKLTFQVKRMISHKQLAAADADGLEEFITSEMYKEIHTMVGEWLNAPH